MDPQKKSQMLCEQSTHIVAEYPMCGQRRISSFLSRSITAIWIVRFAIAKFSPRRG
jgi:hypothetical protein